MLTVCHSARLAQAVSLAGAALALACAGTARAATAPTAITGPVTAVGGTTATLSGTVNPNGTTTTWHFDYGKTTSYGSTTAATNAGAGTANITASSDLTGLSPSTTYHYRLSATSSAGPSQGVDGIFTTSAGPTVVTAAATGVSASGATLNGSVNPNGRPTTYYFEYGKTTAYGSKTSAVDAGSETNVLTVSAAVAGLQSGQVYHFRLDASSDAGTTLGGDLSFTAGASTPTGPTGPAAPPGPATTTKAATAVTTTAATLNGTLNPNGQSTTWYFQYGTTTSYGSTTPTANAGAGTKSLNVSSTLSGLTSGIHHFRLVAASSTGTTYGSDLTFGSAGPPVVLTGSAQGASTTAVTLTGSVNPGGGSTTWYFEYGTTPTYGSKTPPKSAGSGTAPTGVSAALASLTAGTTYHYRLVGSSSGGTSNGGDVTFTTVAALTLNASTTQSVYGHDVTLSGVVWTRETGVKVSVYGQQLGSTSFSTIGSATTGPGGSWSFLVRPKLQTLYRAAAPDGTSSPVAVGVRPAVTLRVITGKRFTARVSGASSFAGKAVQLQRLLPGNRWTTVARAKLSATSSAVFAATALPHGTSLIRVAMSVNQAGRGYLGAFSRTLTYKQ